MKDLWSKQGSHASKKCAHAHSNSPYDGGEDFRWVDKDDAETADDTGLTNQGQGSGQRFNIDGFRCFKVENTEHWIAYNIEISGWSNYLSQHKIRAKAVANDATLTASAV